MLGARQLTVGGVILALAIGAEPAWAQPSGWSAGPVARWTGYWSGDSARVREVQRDLRALRYRPGPVDGLFGPRTERAVLRFQRHEALRVDGVVGPRTLRKLRSRTGGGRPQRPDRGARRPPPRSAPFATAPGPLPPAPSGSPVAVDPLVLALLVLLALVSLTGVGVRSRRARRRAVATPDSGIPPQWVPPVALLPPPRPPVEAAGIAGERLGDRLRADGLLTEAELFDALAAQMRSGGRLGEILVAYGVLPEATLTAALARQLGVATLSDDDQPVPLLAASDARAWRAVALAGRRRGTMRVAVADPSDSVLARLRARFRCRVEPRLCDQRTLDELLNRVYADVDADEVTRALREEAPELSAFRTTLSRTQTAVVGLLGFLLLVGLLADLRLTATLLVGIATAFFVSSTGFRLYAAWQGCRAGATIDPPAEEIAAMDERALPAYTVLLPLYKEKPPTVRALFDALSRMDYPKHKLDCLVLIEADDDQTRAAIEKVGHPPWIRLLTMPPGTPRTKPRAMGIGLRYARGDLVAVYDAEDKPDPAQLKKAAWGFQRAEGSVACLQAKLGYYNPNQNLLTRWFTLEYDAWFNIFLPGLHRIGAPIPLGGTSNHFRRAALEQCLGWDPYNVTEDADLGLRFARLGLSTAMLESTTGEEANSRVPNWLRQRSRWSKGYMQTLLVHTRRPWALVAELGPRGTLAFLLTLGGAVVTALLAPLFWLLLLLWFVAEPEWIAAVFPGPIYYPASLSLVFGNFALVLLGLGAAVSRGHDDLARVALLTPVYWTLMSAATYMALVELFFRPYHWHKTEHGLHLAEEPA